MKQFFNILHYGKLNWMFIWLTFLSFNCLTYTFLNLMWSSNWSDKKILLCFNGDKIILFIKWHLITFDSFIIGSKGDELLESIYMGVHRGIRKGVLKRGYRFFQHLFLVITSLHTKYTQEKMEGQSRLSRPFMELTTPKA